MEVIKMEEQKSVGGWDSYINNFLKADDVESKDTEYVCIEVEQVSFNKSETSLRLHLERSPDKFLFDLNKTNAVFLKTAGIKHPKEIVGKKIYFEKVRAMNPQTKKEVDALRIHKVE